MFGSTILSIVVVGSAVVLLTLLWGAYIEVSGTIRKRALRHRLQVEIEMSEIAQSVTDNITIPDIKSLKKIVDTIVPEQVEVRERILGFLNDAGSHNHAEDILCKAKENDPVKWWQLIYIVNNNPGEPNRASGLLKDINKKITNDRHIASLEDQLMQKQMINRMNKTFTQAVKTPIMAIMKECNLVLNSTNQDEREILLSVARTNLNSLHVFFEKFRLFTAISTNRMEFNNEKILISTFINRIYEQYKEKIEAKGLKFFLIEGREDAHLIIDSKGLSFIFIQMLDNALKFTDRGAIAIGWKSSLSKGSVELFVEDSGKGIETTAIERLFIPGWREDLNKTGSGLGLPIAKLYTEAMNGTITCKSEVGVGSRFSLEFKVV